MPPLLRSVVLESGLAVADRHPRSCEPSLQGVDLDGFPEPDIHGIVGVIITVMAMDQIMGPDITPLGMIIQICDLVAMLAIMGE
jgi:hypothetical protein